MDEPTLIPMFNAYAWAAAMANEPTTAVSPVPTLPCQGIQPLRCQFSQAGLWLDRGPAHYTLINTHKGGVVYHFRQGHRPLIDAGVVVCDAKGRSGSSQAHEPHNRVTQQGDQLDITASITAMPKQLPGPFQFMVLRALCLTAFRLAPLREGIKQQLVRMLITRRHHWPVRNQRTIKLGDALKITDQTDQKSGYRVIQSPGAFVPIHMASQGYWQIQDELGQDEGGEP
jgi:hypothetical protein